MAECIICKDNSAVVNTYVKDNEIVVVCATCVWKGAAKDMVRLFKIPSYNLPVLADKFKKLTRRATKLGLPAPTYTEIGTSRLVRVKTNEIGAKVETVILLSHIVVDAGTNVVKVEGWEFIATIQHTEEGNILRKVGDVPLPVKYRECSQVCEHCNTSRNRKDTYILFNAGSDTYKQVGRSCLQDFFGCDALMYAERCSYLIDLSAIGEASEDSEGSYGGSGERFDMLEVYLSHVAECIKLDGWMSRGRARAIEGAIATSDLANKHLHPPFGSDFRPLYGSVSEESVKMADAAIEWAQGLEGEELSDYLHNIRLIAKRMVVGWRDMGLSASIVAAYQRHLNTLRQKELAAKRAEIATYVGSVGERRVFKLYVEKVLTFDNDFGTSYLHIASDTAGNCFKWYKSGTPFVAGNDIVVLGTVKKHDEYNGVKQNTLSRCVEVEMKNYIAFVNGTKYVMADCLDEKFAKVSLRNQLGIKRLPNGIVVSVDVPEVVSGVDETTLTVGV